jgi:hypothetical protein
MIVDVILPLRPSLKHDATKSATKKGLRERRTVDFPSQQKVFRNLRLHGIGGNMSSLDVLSQLIFAQESSWLHIFSQTACAMLGSCVIISGTDEARQ